MSDNDDDDRTILAGLAADAGLEGEVAAARADALALATFYATLKREGVPAAMARQLTEQRQLGEQTVWLDDD